MTGTRSIRNIGMAMTNSVVTIVVNLVALPFYLRFLGVEAYGLIGFYTMLQAASQVLDLGLAPTMSREAARATTGRHVADLLHTLGIVYFFVSVLIVVLGAVTAPWVGSHWLSGKQLSTAIVVQAITLMGVNLACRWPISLYQAALIGAGRLWLSSAVNITISISGVLVTISVLALWSPTIKAFFLVQACMGLIQMCILRVTAWKVVGLPGARFDIACLRRIWKFSFGMSGIAITSLAFTQFDKVILSKLLDLRDFGYYMLAALLAGGLQVFIAPAFNAIFPRFSSLVASGQLDELSKIYSLGSALLSAALFPLALTLAFHAQDIVTLWTGNIDLAVRVAPLVAMLAIGSALNGMMHFPYALQIAFGMTKIPFGINLGLLVLLVPMTVLLAMAYGGKGGALSWLLVEIVYTFCGTWLTGRKVMPGAGIPWLLRDVGIPLLLSSLIILLGAWIAQGSGLKELPRLGIACLAASVAFMVSIFSNPSSRRWVVAHATKAKRSAKTTSSYFRP